MEIPQERFCEKAQIWPQKAAITFHNSLRDTKRLC